MIVTYITPLLFACQLAQAAVTLKLHPHPDQRPCNDSNGRRCPPAARALEARSSSFNDQEWKMYRMIDGEAHLIDVAAPDHAARRSRSHAKRQDDTDSDSTAETTGSSVDDGSTNDGQPTGIASNSNSDSDSTAQPSEQTLPSEPTISLQSQSDASEPMISLIQDESQQSQPTSEVEEPSPTDGSEQDTQASSASSASAVETSAVYIPLTGLDSQGVVYTVDVEVNGQVIPVVADTGSPYFWVPSQSCETCTRAGMTTAPISLAEGCTVYDSPSKNSTIAGCMANATVAIGEYRLEEQQVLAVSQIPEEIQRQHSFMSGVMGLGIEYDDKHTGKTASVVLEMFNQGMIKAPTVGFYLDPNFWDSVAESSELTLGVVTESAHVNTARSVKLTSTDNQDLGHYVVNLDAMSVPASGNGWSGGSAAIDTGLTGLLVPQTIIKQIHSALHPNGTVWSKGYEIAVPCNRVLDTGENMRDLVVTLGGQDWTVDYMDLIGVNLGFNGLCRSRIGAMARDETGYDFILGATFLKNVYSAFDMSDGSVTIYDVVH